MFLLYLIGKLNHRYMHKVTYVMHLAMDLVSYSPSLWVIDIWEALQSLCLGRRGWEFPLALLVLNTSFSVP